MDRSPGGLVLIRAGSRRHRRRSLEFDLANHPRDRAQDPDRGHQRSDGDDGHPTPRCAKDRSRTRLGSTRRRTVGRRGAWSDERPRARGACNRAPGEVPRRWAHGAPLAREASRRSRGAEFHATGPPGKPWAGRDHAAESSPDVSERGNDSCGRSPRGSAADRRDLPRLTFRSWTSGRKAEAAAGRDQTLT